MESLRLDCGIGRKSVWRLTNRIDFSEVGELSSLHIVDSYCKDKIVDQSGCPSVAGRMF